MTILKNIGIVLLGVVVGLLLGGAVQNRDIGGVYQTVSRDFSEGITVDGNTVITGNRELYAKEPIEVITADNTITVAESGKTFYVQTSVSTSTLPSVTTASGTTYRFVVSGAIATNDFRVVSAEGDNIEGSLIVAGAVVDCDAADRINFVTDGENIGDFVEVRSNGVYWLVTQSNALTSAKLTCSG
jgi:hypothetical protein